MKTESAKPASRMSVDIAFCDTRLLAPLHRALEAQVLAKEPPDMLSYDLPILFEREVTCIEQMELHVLQVALVRIRPGGRKDFVILAPYDQRRRLMLSKVGLPLGIKRRIATVVIEHLELNLLISGAVEQTLINVPIVGADCFRVTDAVGVLPLCGAGRQKEPQRFLVRHGGFLVRGPRSPNSRRTSR